MPRDQQHHRDDDGTDDEPAPLTVRARIESAVEWRTGDGTYVQYERGTYEAVRERLFAAAVIDEIETAAQQQFEALADRDGGPADESDVDRTVWIELYREPDAATNSHEPGWPDPADQDVTLEDLDAAAEEWEAEHDWTVNARYTDYLEGVDDNLLVDLSPMQPYGPLLGLLDLYVDHNDFMELLPPPDDPTGLAARILMTEGLLAVAERNGSVLADAFDFEGVEYALESGVTTDLGESTSDDWTFDPDPDLDLRNPHAHDWVSTESDDPSASSFPSEEEKRERVAEMVEEADVEAFDSIKDLPLPARRDPMLAGIHLTKAKDPDAFERDPDADSDGLDY